LRRHPRRIKPRECRESYKLLNLPRQVGAALAVRVIPKPGYYLGARLRLPVRWCWLKASKDNTHTAGRIVRST